jgi:putative spermidine/putrescine transport system substrate-binding protein
MVDAWNGRVYNAQQDGGEVAYNFSQALLQWDAWTIFKGAKNLENAQKLVTWCSLAANGAEFAKQITYSPANQDSFELLDAERVTLLPTAPENSSSAVVQDYAWWQSKYEGTDKTNQEVFIEKWQEWIANF